MASTHLPFGYKWSRRGNESCDPVCLVLMVPAGRVRVKMKPASFTSLLATTRNRIVVVFYNSTLPNDRFIYFYISFRKLLAFSIPYCSSANLKHSSQSTCSATVGTSAKDFTTSKSSLSLVFLSKLAFLSP